MRRTLPWLLLFLGLLLALPAAVATARQADYQACSPIDVVFLIDQSSSMSGEGSTADPASSGTRARRMAVRAAGVG